MHKKNHVFVVYCINNLISSQCFRICFVQDASPALFYIRVYMEKKMTHKNYRNTIVKQMSGRISKGFN